jgi:protein phosphatase
MISEERIGAVLAGAGGLTQAAQALIDEANAAGGRDNITVVLFRLEEVGSASGIDQPTVVATSLPAGPRQTATPQAASPPSAPVPTAPPPSLRAKRHGPRLARHQGRDNGASRPAGTPRRGHRFAKPVAALVAVIVVLFLVGGGGYLASRQLYFIGTNSHGIVTIFRGFPYDLPAGIHLYETFYVSGVPASDVPPDRRSALLNHHLRSQTSAAQLVRQLELGELVR